MLLDTSLAVNTRETYNTGINAFQLFRTNYKMELLWPPSLEQLFEFIAHLSLKGCSPATARAYLAGIGFNCKLIQVCDVTQNFVIKKMITGMERLDKRVDFRLPIDPHLLRKIIEILPSICRSTYESNLFSAAYSLAYFGFLRVGEIVAESNNRATHALSLSDVNLSSQNTVIEMRIPHSKTDQLGKGTLISMPAVNSIICPVRNIRLFLNIRSKQPGQLFIHFSGAPMTRYQFSSVLKKSLLALGVDSTKYKSHSFRIGAATSASNKGISENGVKELGRWESQSYKSYIRVPTDKLCF